MTAAAASPRKLDCSAKEPAALVTVVFVGVVAEPVVVFPTAGVDAVVPAELPPVEAEEDALLVAAAEVDSEEVVEFQLLAELDRVEDEAELELVLVVDDTALLEEDEDVLVVDDWIEELLLLGGVFSTMLLTQSAAMSV